MAQIKFLMPSQVQNRFLIDCLRVAFGVPSTAFTFDAVAGQHVDPQTINVSFSEFSLYGMSKAVETELSLDATRFPKSSKPSAEIVAPPIVVPPEIGPEPWTFLLVYPSMESQTISCQEGVEGHDPSL